MQQHKPKTIARDISWLSFNARVLQEAADDTVPLRERIRFLGIFSNNMDEFFRVRVATLKRMTEVSGKANMHLESDPQQILDDIQMTVLNQQSEFARIWEDVQARMKEQNISLVTEQQLNPEQQEFVREYYESEVSSNVIPLMIENIPVFPNLRDKSIYLGVVMWKKESALRKKYALIEVPSRMLGRFLQLPSKPDEHQIILLEDIIRFNLPDIFSYFGYDQYFSHIFKVTRDAELDMDSDISTSIIQKIEKGLKNRRKGKPVRFVYDRDMDPGLLEYLMRRLNLTKKANLIPGGRIHNFRHFMDFPESVFSIKKPRKKPFDHPLLMERRVSDVVLERDIMLHLPYHSFTPLIDIIREAAIDPDVSTIKITCYRLAPQSKIINALINAVRNGKEVIVMLELSARFDEEANLEWKARLEEEGAKVLVGIPNMKVHAKLCLIKKKIKERNVLYGFVSTGNMNEKTAKVYADHCLLTSNARVMTDVSRMFNYLEHYRSGSHTLRNCTTIIPSPHIVRKEMYKLINEEIKQARKNKPSGITLKLNSLSDEEMIAKLYEAAREGVPVSLIVRGIFCMLSENKKFKGPVRAISIVDEYLEHARVWVFHNKGKEKVYISSADWMLRNLEHRVEATCPIWDEGIKQELKDILGIQLKDNVKARWLDNELTNEYVRTTRKKVRSQVETYNYLFKKPNRTVRLAAIDIGSNAARLLITDVNAVPNKSPEFIKMALIRVPLRLGFDVFEKGEISQGRAEKFIKTIKSYKLLMDVYEVKQFKACATSAMRDASNGAEILERVKAETGIDIEIISGQQEASFIYENHVAENLTIAESYLYIDVGGGSTELTFFSDGKLIFKESFNIGTIRLLKNQVVESQWDTMKEFIKTRTKGFHHVTAIGSGGNINKIFSISKRKEGKPLSLELLRDYYKEFSVLTLAQRMSLYKLREDRADVLVPALLIYINVMRWADAQEIFVPKIGLADGLVQSLYEEIHSITPVA